MKILILGGNSPRHYDWIRELGGYLEATGHQVILYDYQHWSKGDVSPQSLKLDAEWTPLRKIYRSATPPDEFFAWYNVIIPRGELLWK